MGTSFTSREIIVALSGIVLLSSPGLPTQANEMKIGPAQALDRVEALFIIKTNGEKDLERLASEVSDPTSPRYGQFLSGEQIRGRFGGKSQAIQKVSRYLKKIGLEPEVDPMGLYVSASMPVGDASQMFHSRISVYGNDGADHYYLKPESKPEIPKELASYVEDIAGLDQTPISKRTPNLASKAALENKNIVKSVFSGYSDSYVSPLPNTGKREGCAAALSTLSHNTWPTNNLFQTPSFTPNQWVTAYGLDQLHNQGLTGSGERIALIEIDGFDPKDISQYNTCFGIPDVAIQTHSYPGGPNLAPVFASETTLDLETITPVAYGLSRIDVWESTDGKGLPNSSNTALAKTLSAAVFGPSKSDRPTIVSISLSSCEASGNASINLLYEKVLKRVALSGVSVFASTGDHGVTFCDAAIPLEGAPISANFISVSYPASSSWITAVGGTNLALNSDNIIQSEIVWNNPLFAQWINQAQTLPLMESWASTGGLSNYILAPKWQAEALPGYSHRGVPDVALLADNTPGYANLSQGQWYPNGGTSASAPLMAAGVALINQGLREAKKSRVGFFNPAMYTIAYDPKLGQSFNDVVVGNNNTTWQTPVGGYDKNKYSAKPGYDLTTGLGSPRFPQLMEAVSKIKR